MKNTVFGVGAGLLILYVILTLLSLYCLTSRKNQIENELSEVLYETMKSCYCGDCFWEDSGASHTKEAVDYVTSELKRRLSEQGQKDSLQIQVLACDMEKGILSVEVRQTFLMPSGLERTIESERTVIMEREVD